MKPVAIIGGGITGLTAAFRLKQQDIPVTLYESGHRVGGVIQSVRRDGYLAESGPNAILETSPIIGELVHDLELEGRRRYTNPAAENRYLVRNGKLVPLPDSVSSFLTSPLFSLSAKLRLLAEPFIGRAPAGEEESVAEFVLRRLGMEFLDYAIDPLVGGIYAGDPARLSVRQAFPKLHAVEEKYRSLLAGQILGARERKRRAEVSKQTAKKFSFDEGLQVLTDELGGKLGPAIMLDTPVGWIEQTEEGWFVGASYRGAMDLNEHSAVLFAGTAHGLARMKIIAHGAPQLSFLSDIYYPPVASMVLGFRREDVAHPLNGFGVLVPKVEDFNILGAIFSSSLFPNRAPAGHVSLTCYVGGARDPSLALSAPEKLKDLVVADLRKLLGVSGEPVFAQETVYLKAIPQYEVGYGRFKDLMRDTEDKCPGFFMAGHYRDGISLGDSIVSGHKAAQRIRDFLTSPRPAARSSELQIKTTA
jgi:protoporphyrinogen/coproporphyrinogen III oxidase